MENNNTQLATFGAGCFWGVEAAYRKFLDKGITATRVGYAGGQTENPTYEQVCGKGTGHAEVVEITYDPNQISYKQLLDIFWQVHDPTQLNRQAGDIGDQYRTVIFYHDDEQKAVAEADIAKFTEENRWSKPIVTQVLPATTFYEAEDYHQKYLEKNPSGYCHVNLDAVSYPDVS